MHRIILLFVISYLLPLWAAGQMSPSNNEDKELLLKVLNRHTKYPRELAEKNISSCFSIKIVFSGDNQIDKIVASKYAPPKMASALTNPAYYEGIKWNAIFNRKVVKGDILIVPFVAYNKTANQSIFHEYLPEDLFEYQGQKQDFINCLIMQTYVINYGNIVK